MRWSNLEIAGEEERTLAGYRDPAVVRRFDAPEAMDVRFYEVRARSALNRVPDKSAVPFRWTVNPYRGCTHACTYCASGDTPILMADLSHRPLADVRPGDEIYGTIQDADRKYRRYAVTQVLDHWSVVKPAWRVTLSDGRTLVTSGDHRLLSRRGWKHVYGTEYGGPHQRPHLTRGAQLLGTGPFAAKPAATEDYRRGYLCGMVRGDGHLRSYLYDRAGRSVSVHGFRLALTDIEALERTRQYLDQDSVDVNEFLFSAGGGPRRPMYGLRTASRPKIERIRRLIAWPLSPSDDWRKGFLAGIFDAEGSAGGINALRISNCDAVLLGWIKDCLRHFAFRVVTEATGKENGLEYVRFRGGLPERIRFLQLTDPAITRKRSIAGVALKNPSPACVESVEPLGLAMRLYDITTGTGDFIANGVVSHNCFARPTHKFLDFDAGRDFEREIVVKVNAPEVLRVELSRPSWKREHVALGTNTDPYQWVEGRYKLMPEIWSALSDARNPCSVLTKSPLLLRDVEHFQKLTERTSFSACLSVPTLDEKAWRASEPHTPNPRARLEAVAELNRAGVPTGILVAPLMPGINDDPAQVERILELAREAGAVSIGGLALHLRGDVRQVFMDWLRSYRPDLVPRYEALYRRGAYAPESERRRLAGLVGSPWPRRWRLSDEQRGGDSSAAPPESGGGALEQPSLF